MLISKSKALLSAQASEGDDCDDIPAAEHGGKEGKLSKNNSLLWGHHARQADLGGFFQYSVVLYTQRFVLSFSSPHKGWGSASGLCTAVDLSRIPAKEQSATQSWGLHPGNVKRSTKCHSTARQSLPLLPCRSCWTRQSWAQGDHRCAGNSTNSYKIRDFFI